jgi:hypothetical protein
MATYNVNGEVYNFPDDITDERAMELIQSSGSNHNTPVSPTGAPSSEGVSSSSRVMATPTPAAGMLAAGQPIDPDTLTSDQDWLDASAKLYRYNNPGNFQGTPKDLAEYGLDQMGWFNYNLPVMAVDGARLTAADDDTKRAFVHLMDKYDNLEMSWSGAGRFIKASATDPTNYTGLGSLGIGTVAAKGARALTKAGIKEILKAGLIGAADAAIITATHDTIDQSVRINAGTQQEFDYGQLAKSATIGAAAGELLGAAARGVSKVFGKEAGLAAKTELHPTAAEALQSAQEAVRGKPGTTLAAPPVEAGGGAHVTAGNDNPHFVPLDEGKKLGLDKLSAPDENGLRTRSAAVHMDGETFTAHDHTTAMDKATEKLGPGVEARIDANPNDHLGFESKTSSAAEPKPLEPNAGADHAPAANDNFVQPNAPNRIIAAINRYVTDTGARVFHTGADLHSDTEEAVKIITSLTKDEAASVVNDARMGKFGPEGTMAIKDAFARGTQKIGEELKANRGALNAAQAAKVKDFQVIGELQRRANDLQHVYDTVRDVDLKFSSITGHELQGRVGLTNTTEFRDVSPDSILREKGHDPLLVTENSPIRRQAEAEFQDRLEKAHADTQRAQSMTKLKAEADDLFAKGDTAGAILKEGEHSALEAAIAAERDAKLTGKERVYQTAHKTWLQIVEYTIGTVFKTSTVLVNLVPHLILTPTRPMMEFLLRGGGAENYAAMKAAYSAMYQHSGEALRAAGASYRYEAELLGAHGAGTASKYLEHGATIPGKIGGAIRFFPRVLQATDQIFKRSNYRSYVASYSASQAFKDALSLGLKSGSPEMKKYINETTQNALDHAFKDPHDGGSSTIKFLRQTGMRKGITPGPKLNQWIQQELTKNSDLFREAASESGRNFADDMAFRREFSGKGFTSGLAKDYEGYVNNHPWMKFFGQLFFRTPVRVFEEGIRLTPGLNMIAPGFLRDLTGKGAGGAGGTAQVRAQAEAMLSLAFAGSTFAAYANGKVTGSGPSDWKLNKTQVREGFEPYTYSFSDGTKYQFRNFDPFATPFKIMINAMDRYADIQYRQAQGETINNTHLDNVVAHSVIPALAIVQAIKDANLTEGISELIDLGHDLSDPETNSSAIMRFFSRKAQLIVPNQANALMQAFSTGGNNFNDPKTFEQYILAKVNPGSGSIPKRYDPLGNNMKNANPFNGLWGIPVVTTDAQRDNVMDERSQAINHALGELTTATNKSFIPGYTAAQWAAGSNIPTAGLSGMDLRETMTKDGRETLYDRLNRYVNQSDLKKHLGELLVDNPRGSIGTPTAPGTRTDAATKYIQLYRAQAFARVMVEEGVFKPDIIQALRAQAESKAGLRDALGAPFQ